MNLKKIGDKTRTGFKKFWYLLWRDNSLKGWIFSMVFLFIFIKFIFFPILSFVTGTSLPLAIVESCSMYHQTNIASSYDSWFERHESKYAEFNITKKEFQNFVLKRGFNKGDILFIIKADSKNLKIGDIILFSSINSETPVIHRIISIKEANGKRIFSTIGDNNNQMLNPNNNLAGVDEREITEDQLVGKAVLKIVPLAGWAKLIFYENLRPSSERGFCDEN